MSRMLLDFVDRDSRYNQKKKTQIPSFFMNTKRSEFDRDPKKII